MYNTIAINPGYAGTRETTSIFGLHRNQWVGLDGAPVTNNISIQTPLNLGGFGMGLSLVNDKIGPSQENNISLDLAYRININDNYKLSFGIKTSFDLLSVDFSKLNVYDRNDNSFETNIRNRFSPNFGVGVFLYSENTYIGISAPRILETTHYENNVQSSSTQTRLAKEKSHYYFIVGHVFSLNEDFKFKPSILTKVVQGSPLQIDLSANALYSEKYMMGLAYRFGSSFSALAGFQVSDSWFIGYSYDMETTKLRNYNSGSHEIFLRFELFNKYSKVASTRFF
jgi:type IX secretion system PorP/SprF family membrane protein